MGLQRANKNIVSKVAEDSNSKDSATNSEKVAQKTTKVEPIHADANQKVVVATDSSVSSKNKKPANQTDTNKKDAKRHNVKSKSNKTTNTKKTNTKSPQAKTKQKDINRTPKKRASIQNSIKRITSTTNSDVVGYLDPDVDFKPSTVLLERNQYLRKEIERRRRFFAIRHWAYLLTFQGKKDKGDKFSNFDDLKIIRNAKEYREWDLYE